MRKRCMWGILCCLHLPLVANMGPQGFTAYLNRCFVETGTYYGSSVQKALDVGFSEVRTIENDINNFQYCVERFKGLGQVKVYYGDSSQYLWVLIHDINEPVTFWLDAHIYPPRADGGKNCPLMEELEQIRLHPIKTHTILIDDMHCCGTESFDYLTKADIIKKVLEINPNYEISFVPGGDQGEYPVNVMVAKLTK